MPAKIIQLKSNEEIITCFPLMQQLRPQLDQAQFLDLVTEAIKVDRYHLFALLSKENIVSVIGFKPMTTLYYGRFIWVCDLVTHVDYRSKGYGEKLLNFTESWAKDHQYTSIALSSGMQRTDAHRFYQQKMHYGKVSYVFKKDI
ncbi:Acetyltransferase (GNAT) domain-containing protein [Amphibacillus marinus]|uniref:Acetyltransferase (GNAT) domain-containing protein n=1 Tax=Amphibacillus marinus TaxID=872970 RepID=A0A1H8LSY2_9BACI|nr:GNAT family N-acetyltransferase [Amphibacillus marinus]SEO08247.1 Acetyltransferase (GNAT) domain-containing protein [Amphibacillus marinus]